MALKVSRASCTKFVREAKNWENESRTSLPDVPALTMFFQLCARDRVREQDIYRWIDSERTGDR